MGTKKWLLNELASAV